jgi:hypothetical protein
MWTTAAPNYAGCYFDLSNSVIAFAPEPRKVSVGFVQSVTKEVHSDDILYTVSYMENGGRNIEWSFFYSPQEQVIRFKNQYGIMWTRARTG